MNVNTPITLEICGRLGQWKTHNENCRENATQYGYIWSGWQWWFVQRSSNNKKCECMDDPHQIC